MNEPISSLSVSGIKHLNSKAVVSLEMAMPTQEIHVTETISVLQDIEADLLKTENLLVEMVDIRSAIETSLSRLHFSG